MRTILATRSEAALERLSRARAPQLYRYCLCVLGDPDDAAQAVRRVLDEARHAVAAGTQRFRGDTWLLALAHAECRRRVALDEAADEPDEPAATACERAELSISRLLDGRAGRRERRDLRTHLRTCPECAEAARRHALNHAAFRSLADLPVPPLAVPRSERAPRRRLALRLAAAGAALAAAGTLVHVGLDGIGGGATDAAPVAGAPSLGERRVSLPGALSTDDPQPQPGPAPRGVGPGL